MALSPSPGRTIAAGFLCAVAATVSVWSGPLAAASRALHSSGTTAAHVALHSSDHSVQTVR
jgi:hypothetical protein